MYTHAHTHIYIYACIFRRVFEMDEHHWFQWFKENNALDFISQFHSERCFRFWSVSDIIKGYNGDMEHYHMCMSMEAETLFSAQTWNLLNSQPVFNRFRLSQISHVFLWCRMLKRQAFIPEYFFFVVLFAWLKKKDFGCRRSSLGWGKANNFSFQSVLLSNQIEITQNIQSSF